MKYKIYVTEKVKFIHEMVIEVPDGCEIETILDNSEKGRNLSDVGCLLTEQDCNIISITRDDSGDSEIKIEDMDEIE
jgi:hypothetical protein